MVMLIFNAMFSKSNGGLEQTFLNYIPTLQAAGHEVISIIHPWAQIKNSCPQDNLIKVFNFNQFDVLAIYKLRKLIKKYRPDCIITHSHRAAYLFSKTYTKVPKIAVCHVQGNYKFGSDAVIAITEAMRQDIIASGVSANKVFTVPNMLNVPGLLEYSPPGETKIPVIGVCARFSPIKGVDIFIHALAELKKRQVLFKAKIAGDGPEKENYIELIKTYGLQDDVSLLGWIEDKSNFYQAIDIFCVPSREEAFGLVILEAMLYSLPMVVSQLPGPIEIIGQSQCALFFEANDVIKMADALQSLIKDKNLAKLLASNAYEHVQHYSSQKIAKVLDTVLQTVTSP
jgi:glycosyltransferase involved in cell wall biosynthesis